MRTALIAAVTRCMALLLAALLAAAPVASAADAAGPQPGALRIDLRDRSALRDGALYFANRCLPCHSLAGARFSELAGPLGLSRDEVQTLLNTTGRRYQETIVSPMPADIATAFLAAQPPDLTVVVQTRGVDWLYAYLRSFYLDPARPTGTNNVVFPNVAMPDVLADLQGLQAPVWGQRQQNGVMEKVAVGVTPLTPGAMSPEGFDRTVQSIVAFLDLVAHPHATERTTLGWWVLALLALLTINTYFVYRSYWRRVLRPAGGRWWTYWRVPR